MERNRYVITARFAAMDIKVPLDVYIETLRTAAREGDSFQWSLG
jgi:hypothetical protein